MEIHIYNLLNVPIAVDIKDSLKNEIGAVIQRQISSLARELKIKPTRLYEYFIWKKSLIPIKILFNISTKLNIPKQKVEKNISKYRQLSAPLKNSISSPKLPIQVNPYLTAIVSHLFFDGSMPKDGKGAYYNQKNEQIMNDFIKKIKHIFGEVSYSLRLDHRKVLKCRIPRLIGEICKYIYDVNSFGSFDSKIPQKIFNLNNEHKIAFVLTAIIDEGSIAYDGSIQFGVSNKKMMEDFQKLCNKIGLETKPIRKTKSGKHYYTYITSLKKLQKILNSFNKKYPLISLRYKEERLKKVLEIKKQKFYNTKNFADKRISLILDDLKKKGVSVNYLADRFLIPPRTIRRYMYKLMKEKKVFRKKIRNEYIYFVPH